MSQDNQYLAQARMAEQMYRQFTSLLPTYTFVEGGVHVMRFPEDEFPESMVLEPVRILRVEIGHILLKRLDDRRTWMSKEDAARRCYDALEVMKNMGVDASEHSEGSRPVTDYATLLQAAALDNLGYDYESEACSWHLHNHMTLVATLNWGGGLPSEVLEARAKLFAAVPELVAQYEQLVEELRLTREREVDLKREILRLKEEAGKPSR